MKSAKFKKPLIILAIFVAIPILLIIYAFIEPYWIQIKTTDIHSDQIPGSFNGMKIVFISDIHLSKDFSRKRLGGIVDKINNLHPDMILLGGDYTTNESAYVQPCFEELSKLKAPFGKFGVLGNHDHPESAALTRLWMKKAGISCMDNNSTWLTKNGDRIKIGGVGDFWYDTQLLENTINDVSEKDFVMLLSHNPDYIEKIKTKKVDLVLSGHSHGGQITLFGAWLPFVPEVCNKKYRTGLIKTDYTTVLVSNGLGFFKYPIRFCARPQINVINLKKDSI